jgi:cyclophilin family peptidyl-prolyl cis-trans isomerase
VGTAKRERQKANRQVRLEALQKEQAKKKRNRFALRWGSVALVLVVGAFILWLFTHKSGSSASTTTTAAGATSTAAGATTTAAAPKAFAYGTGACPKPDGSSPKTQTFKAAPKQCIDPTKTYTAVVNTNKGSFTVVLDPKQAPGTVNNFVTLARYHFFDNTPCHRIIADFVVQCGDPTGKGTGGPGYTIPDELPQAGQYKVGSLAMANTGTPNTGGSQFFVITGDQGSQLPPSYSLFGQVTDGLNTTVKALNAEANPSAANGVPPKTPVTINSVTIKES